MSSPRKVRRSDSPLSPPLRRRSQRRHVRGPPSHRPKTTRQSRNLRHGRPANASRRRRYRHRLFRSLRSWHNRNPQPSPLPNPRHAPPRKRSRAPQTSLRHPHGLPRLSPPAGPQTQEPRNQKHLLHLPAILGLATLARPHSPPSFRASTLHFSL